ncbi:MAG TPA: type II secretion system protein [Candidatus Acidoferrum sp.]|nr:type II secretion system protein [Candidatus Acidoferrum sp.]
MQLKNNRKAGFTLVEIMIVVAIIGLLAAIAIPNFIRARQSSQVNACINNLRQIEGAKATYALEAKLQGTSPVTMANIAGTPTSYIATTPECPAGGNYTVATVDAKTLCNIPLHVLP